MYIIYKQLLNIVSILCDHYRFFLKNTLTCTAYGCEYVYLLYLCSLAGQVIQYLGWFSIFIPYIERIHLSLKEMNNDSTSSYSSREIYL